MHRSEPLAQQSLLGSPEMLEKAKEVFTSRNSQMQNDLTFQMFCKEEILEMDYL